MKYTIRMIVKTGFGGRDLRVLHKEIDLPITPFIGLNIVDGNGFEARIRSIVYNINTKELELWNKMDDRICKARSRLPKGEYPTLEEVVAEYVRSGWKEDDHG